ncbi:MAG: zf-HC2 domain-containing protein [Chloroflexales bacterium]|nr:zf-HC2 domain-containing protein [Chloroflexales bacterium]
MNLAGLPLTSCADPPALTDLELIAALDNEAPPEVVRHLRSCRHCATRVEELAQMQQQLRSHLYRAFCPSSQRLVEYRRGALAYEQRAAIATHIANCPHCTRELALVEQAVELR